MNNTQSPQFKKLLKVLLIVAGFGVVGLLTITPPGNETSKPVPQTEAVATSSATETSAVQKTFAEKSRERFDKIAAAIPELDHIECADKECKYVAAFHFKTIPTDLKIIMQTNTVFFSDFKIANNEGSNVTIVAIRNGNILMECKASGGKLDSCK